MPFKFQLFALSYLLLVITHRWCAFGNQDTGMEGGKGIGPHKPPRLARGNIRGADKSGKSRGKDFKFEGGNSLASMQCSWKREQDKHHIPVYFINAGKSLRRRNFMEQQMKIVDLHSHTKRIEAVFPLSPTFNITLLEKPCKRNTPHDLAIILSHLTAIYTAVHDTSPMASKHPYALILEDDVRFLFSIDWQGLVDSVPDPQFGILQLVTSNIEGIEIGWENYKRARSISNPNPNPNPNPNLRSTNKTSVAVGMGMGMGMEGLWSPNLWTTLTKDKKYPLYWGALAYLIQKEKVKDFLHDVIDVDPNTGSLSFKIVNSFFPQSCKRTKQRPCILANCLFSDSYIYAGAGPTYVSNIPLFQGAEVGMISETHQEQVSVHVQSFRRIDAIYNECRNGTMGQGNKLLTPLTPLPSFLKLPTC